MAIGASHIPLQDVLRKTEPTYLSRFQRRYEWEVKNMDDLLYDLMRAFNENRTRNFEKENYFLGSVIIQRKGHVQKKGDVETGYDAIVDGQQRLTSISIIYAVMRDLTSDEARKRSFDSILTIPADIAFKVGGTEQRLELHRFDNHYYRDNIVSWGATAALKAAKRPRDPSHQRLRDNALRAREILEDSLNDDERIEFSNFIQNGCGIVQITLDQQDDSKRIFDIMNTRGVPVGSHDILRVELIDAAAKDEDEWTELIRGWDYLENSVGQSQMQRFASQIHFLRMEGNVSDGRLPEEILTSFKSQEEINAYVKEGIREQGRVFNEVVNARVSDIEDRSILLKINHRLRSLNLVRFNERLSIGFDEWIGLAMLFIERFRSDPSELMIWLEKLDRFAWYYFLISNDKWQGEDRLNRFRGVLKAFLSNTKPTPSSCGLHLSQENKIRMRELIDRNHERKAFYLRNLIVRTEYAMRSTRTGREFRDCNIEHILPYSPNWKSKAYWNKYFKDHDAIMDAAGWLGNVCLVPFEINDKLGSEPYPDKIEILRDEGLLVEDKRRQASVMVPDDTRYPDWDRGAIDKRSDEYRSALFHSFDISGS